MAGIVASLRQTGKRWFSLRPYRVRWPEWVAALAGVLLLAALVGLTWYTRHPPSGGLGKTYFATTSENGWRGLAHAHWLLLVTVLAAFGLIFFQAARPAPPVAVTFSLLTMVLGALTTIWLVVRVVIDPPAGRNFGGWLALISAAVLTWAGYKSMRLEGIAPQDAPSNIPEVSLREAAVQNAQHAAESSARRAQKPEPAEPS